MAKNAWDSSQCIHVREPVNLLPETMKAPRLPNAKVYWLLHQYCRALHAVTNNYSVLEQRNNVEYVATLHGQVVLRTLLHEKAAMPFQGRHNSRTKHYLQIHELNRNSYLRLSSCRQTCTHLLNSSVYDFQYTLSGYFRDKFSIIGHFTGTSIQ